MKKRFNIITVTMLALVVFNIVCNLVYITVAVADAYSLTHRHSSEEIDNRIDALETQQPIALQMLPLDIVGTRMTTVNEKNRQGNHCRNRSGCHLCRQERSPFMDLSDRNHSRTHLRRTLDSHALVLHQVRPQHQPHRDLHVEEHLSPAQDGRPDALGLCPFVDFGSDSELRGVDLSCY